MNLQDFCDEASQVDKLQISFSDSFVVKATKPDGTVHILDGSDVLEFLEFLSSNHADCVAVIEGDSAFTADSFLRYQEGPYRALYKHGESANLMAIATVGSSQTKTLTQVISKLIAYLAGMDYQSVSNNTLFDKATVDEALKNKPSDLRSLVNAPLVTTPMSDAETRKEQFERYLRHCELAESTVRKYSVQVIAKADQLLVPASKVSGPLYEIELAEVVVALEYLESNEDWQRWNSDGNKMYQSGMNKYLAFMKEKLAVFAGCVGLPKPFILLAGISGTGKTRFVRRQAAATARNAQSPENFCLVPVRPDWHEPSDLLGYVSRIGDEPRFISTKALNFMIAAWRAVAPDADAEGPGELAPDAPPYWLCLDEMNLAPVEQYFADYLSVLETREVKEGVYRSEPLLHGAGLQKNEEDGGDVNYRRDLGLEKDHDEGLWQFFCAYGIQLPPNLIVAGTVNMDETTHGFSRKVIDRALTMDFGEFFPNDFDLIFGGQCEPVALTYSVEARARQEELKDTFDGDGEKTIEFLKEVNGVLRGSPFELAYRALNEVLLHVVCFKPKDELGLQAVWDDFLMTKVLPRIEGDADKLMSIQPDSASNLLDDLEDLLRGQLGEIWNDSDNGSRPNLFQKAADGQSDLMTDCRSRKKLQWMKRRLETNTFTSFWP
jgi:hypothetical protein